jgi:hypothetical protein
LELDSKSGCKKFWFEADASAIVGYMYSLFRRLSQNNYWKMLLQKVTWLEALTSLRRAHKDKRARKHLLLLALMLLIPLGCALYLIVLVGSGGIFMVPFVIPVLWWRKRREKQDEVLLHIAPGPKQVKTDLTEEKRQALRSYFAKLALFYAVMVDRAGSESFLKEKVLPEGFEVTSRRIHLELLRTHGLWDQMAQADREAMMMADGHWDWQKINHVSLAMEYLRLLCWILRMDFYLPVVGQRLRGDYRMAHEVVHAPDKMLEGKDLVDVSAMRTGREAAEQFFVRCWAEGISRGYYQGDGEETTEWASSLSEKLRGKQHEDFVLGDKLVSEASENELRVATLLSERRRIFLGWTMVVMDEGNVPEWQMSVFSVAQANEVVVGEQS